MLPRLVALVALSLAAVAHADTTAGTAAAKLPVTEVTVFKDGHAFILQCGSVTPDATGAALVADLPVPVLGTFWAYSADRSVRLTSATGTQRLIHIERPAMSVQDLVEANIGAQVELNFGPRGGVSGKILDVPRATPDPPRIDAATQRQEAGPVYDSSGYYLGYGNYSAYGGMTYSGKTVLIETKAGILAMPLGSVGTARFPAGCKRTVSRDDYRPQVALRVSRADGSVPSNARVGMLYLQKGIRWIPSYRIDLDGKGHAKVTMQATILNELVDIDDATVNLVVGVPTFFFKDTPDPISLRQAFPPLSRFFNADSQTGFAFSNVIGGQGGGYGGFGGGGVGGGGARYIEEPGDDPESGDAECCYAAPDGDASSLLARASQSQREEDLFVFTVRHVSLKKGESVVVPVMENTVEYSDVYTLHVGLKPPASIAKADSNSAQAAEAKKLLETPRATHVVRMRNTSHDPLTTAPALISSGERILAQGLLRYVPVGGQVDLTVTTSGDVEVRREETEAARTQHARQHDSFWLDRVDVRGQITLANFSQHPIEIEVLRPIPGPVDEVSAGGAARPVGPMDTDRRELDEDQWNYWEWPYWWGTENIRTRILWKVTLPPGKPIELTYKWHYFTT